MTELWNKIRAALFSPVSIMSLVVFRVTFGAIMLWEVFRYFKVRVEPDGDKFTWIEDYWIEPKFNFSYEWFEWVKPWEGDGMYLHFYLLGILSVLIMLGLFYRVATVLMFFAFTYTFLLEQARYLNHFHLVSILSFLMIFVPAHRKYSLDAILWKKIRTDYVPGWTVFLIASQVGIAYFFGGVAKLNYDWLILAEPMQHWLAEQTNYPVIGSLFDKKWMAYFMAWSGMFLDLLAPFLLWNRKTRPFMFAAVFSFHVMNDRLFQIGIFPWFMIPASTIFFSPDWFNKFVAMIKANYKNQGAVIVGSGILFSFIGLLFRTRFDNSEDAVPLPQQLNFELLPFLITGLGGAILAWLFIDLFTNQTSVSKQKKKIPLPVYAYSKPVVVFLGIWVTIQIVLPLRHLVIPGNPSWTEEGHRFSWHMKLRDKEGSLRFFSYDPATGDWDELNWGKYIKKWQFNKMVHRPYMIHQFAKFLDKELEKKGKGHYEIHVESFASLNFRPRQMLIDPGVDLSKQTYSDFYHNDWILQLDETLKPETVQEMKEREQWEKREKREQREKERKEGKESGE